MKLFIGKGAPALLLLFVLVNSSFSQETGEPCSSKFKKGKDEFVLDTDKSMKQGAVFISSPNLFQERDCVAACCKEPKCNLAFIQTGDGEKPIESCFLFDCLYKNTYACHFVTKQGFTSYVLDSVYEAFLKRKPSIPETDSPPVAKVGFDLVIQPGETVTLSGYQSTDDHEIKSYKWEILSDYPAAKFEKTNFPDQLLVSNLTSGKYKFKLTVTDKINQSDSAILTVLVLNHEESEHHCKAPKKTGPCRGSFPRWHYNAASQKCEQFLFGGCRENRNNYLTQKQCESACSGSAASRGLPGGQPDKRGLETCGSPCSSEQFTCANKCCVDIGYECDGKSQCSDGSDEHKCDSLIHGFGRLLQIQIEERKARCTDIVDTGSCHDSLSKWYYDPIKKSCFRFNYGGCEGNDNKFDSEGECNRFCNGITEKDVVIRPGMFEKSTGESNKGIIIAICLSVAIIVMLCVVGYCCYNFKNKRSKEQLDAHTSAPWNDDKSRHIYCDNPAKPF